MFATRTVRWGLRRSCFALVLVAVLSTSSLADMYTGSLSSGNGLTGIGAWATGANLSWTVDNTTTPGYWHYSYTLSVTEKDISHLIVETSTTFTAANLFNLGWSFYEIGTFDEDNGNPGMGSSSMFGLKIDKTSGTSVTISFDSNRIPVWGDFYGDIVKCCGWKKFGVCFAGLVEKPFRIAEGDATFLHRDLMESCMIKRLLS